MGMNLIAAIIILSLAAVCFQGWLMSRQTKALSDLIRDILGMGMAAERIPQKEEEFYRPETVVFPDETVGVIDGSVLDPFLPDDTTTEMFMEQLDESSPAGYREAAQWEAEDDF